VLSSFSLYAHRQTTERTDKLAKNRQYIAYVDLKAKTENGSRGKHVFKKEAV
jgi:hypothetical protein